MGDPWAYVTLLHIWANLAKIFGSNFKLSRIWANIKYINILLRSGLNQPMNTSTFKPTKWIDYIAILMSFQGLFMIICHFFYKIKAGMQIERKKKYNWNGEVGMWNVVFPISLLKLDPKESQACVTPQKFKFDYVWYVNESDLRFSRKLIFVWCYFNDEFSGSMFKYLFIFWSCV